jgi:hypothetical protein
MHLLSAKHGSGYVKIVFTPGRNRIIIVIKTHVARGAGRLRKGFPFTLGT